jgi:hypothetical protein
MINNPGNCPRSLTQLRHQRPALARQPEQLDNLKTYHVIMMVQPG